jgi:hypothetical protein
MEENVVNKKLKEQPRRLPAANMAVFLVKLPSSWKNIVSKNRLKMTRITKGLGRTRLKVSRRQKPLMRNSILCIKRAITLSSSRLTFDSPRRHVLFKFSFKSYGTRE